MPDIADLLTRTTPTDLATPDLGGIARRARRRRTRRRAAMAAVVVVAAGLTLRATGDAGDDVLATTSLGNGEILSIASAEAAEAVEAGAGQARLLPDNPVEVVLFEDVTDELRTAVAAWLTEDPRVAGVQDTTADGRPAFRVQLVAGTTEGDVWTFTEDAEALVGVEVINLPVELVTP